MKEEKVKYELKLKKEEKKNDESVAYHSTSKINAQK